MSAPFGPFSDGIAEGERTAQLRALAALSAVHLGSQHPLIRLLRGAERRAETRAIALAMLDATPTLTRRRIIATFASIHHPRYSRNVGNTSQEAPDGT